MYYTPGASVGELRDVADIASNTALLYACAECARSSSTPHYFVGHQLISYVLVNLQASIIFQSFWDCYWFSSDSPGFCSLGSLYLIFDNTNVWGITELQV